jgi:hypothetical protein
MRKTLGGAALPVLCMLVTTAALAGSITTRGVAQPTLQTIFRIDTPAEGSTVFGIVEVKGYILDPRGVSRITLLIDGAAVHDADLNQARTDVQRRYPRYFGADFPSNPGFVTSFLASNYTSGAHTLALRVTYSNSDVAELGTRTVTVDNTVSQAPIGALDTPHDPAVYGTVEYVSSVYPVTGWVLDAQGIRTTTAADGSLLADIEIMVDGLVVGQAFYPLQRPDVANAHPDVVGALNSGFQMNLDTTRYGIGIHTISVRAVDTGGLSSVIGGREVYISNDYGSLGPFGRIDYPMADAHMFSTSCVQGGLPSGVEYGARTRIEWVSGWVLDQNDQQRFQGVTNVELYLDGTLLHSTATDCAYLSAFGMNVNCYGLERPDILYQYPQFTDAKNSGFFFAVDVGYLINTLGIVPGLHTLSIRAVTADPLRPAEFVDQIPVILECNLTGQGFSSFGELEQPGPMESLMGNVVLQGWVYDYDQVQRLNVYVDGVLDGSLIAGAGVKLNLPRPDLAKRYPFYPFGLLANTGFEYTLDTTKYVDGVHQIVLETVDLAGLHNYWVQRAEVFDNAN